MTPYLLPVSLTLLDDDNLSINRTQLFVSATSCKACTEGMICSAQAGGEKNAADYRNQKLESIRIEPGFYRVSATSEVVVECPVERACVGNDTSGGGLCSQGHSGPMCQVCLDTVEATYVWSNNKCAPCESSHKGTMYGLLIVVLILMSLMAYKYKIVVKLLQTLFKITTLYPDITFPAVFSQVVQKFNIFVNLDVNVLPFNCIVSSSNFHDKILLMTFTALACIAYIGLVYFYQHRRILFENDAAEKSSAKLGVLTADCVCYALVFLYTIFSLVSATIIRTFNYDRRLEAVTGESYLIADYKIHKSDADQKVYVVYAAVVFVVYCVGIPATPLHFLWSHTIDIQELQECL